MKKICLFTILMFVLCLAPIKAAQNVVIPLPNSSFEKAGTGAVDGYFINSKAFVPAKGETFPGLPDEWTIYQWGGPMSSRFSVTVDKAFAHSGNCSLRLENLDGSAKAGIYTLPKLAAGTYELSVWARTEKGKVSRLAVYLQCAYSRPMKVTDQWTKLVFKNSVRKDVEHAEINLQNCGGVSVVWIDDVELRRVGSQKIAIVPDNRKERPRTLLFSPMNINYLRDTAKDWGARGFRGFLFDGIMASWPSDIWAVDGDPKTRGEDDKLLQEMRACNTECRRYGIDSNFIKVAFYDDLPDWFDDAAWAKLTENYRQGARFAKMSGCAGIAIDTEYTAYQFDPAWEGYKKNPHDVKEMKAKARERWRTVTAAMLKEYPTMPLLTLPEGMIYYGPLYMDVLIGILQAYAEIKAPGGVHVMTEGTYQLTNPLGLAAVPEQINGFLEEECDKSLSYYWKRKCSVVLGVWPLGYYRAINDANGKFVGWAGKKEKFGDQIIGSYADKSENYPLSEFKEQMAGVNTFCPRYNWIYGHGCVFWQWTEDEKKKYEKCLHKSMSNSMLPTVANLQDYFDIIAKPMRVIVEK